MDPALINVIQTLLSGGPAAIFALMWWLERQERLDLSKKLYQTLTSMGEMNDAWLKILKGNKGETTK